jgi:BirA family biotin operon repressor/biotin-[acetyl-CoA-carboxylase] ligase
MWNIQTFAELPSTQTLARTKLDNGVANHGDVFIALHQSEGRGQYNWRLWYDEPGANLLLSTILTEVPPAVIDLMQFVAGLSVLTTIRTSLSKEILSFDENRVRLKWPNDILLDGKKISGILSEAVWSGQSLKGIILGVGINVNQQRFAEPIITKATSLRAVLSHPFTLETIRDLFLATLASTLEKYSDRHTLLADLRRELLWMSSLPKVSATQPDGFTILGSRILGISDSGALHISTRDGVEQLLQSATITLDE